VSCIDARGVERSVDINIVKHGQQNEQKVTDKRCALDQKKRRKNEEGKKRKKQDVKKGTCLLV
jgi:hypothetical protein